MAIDYKKALLYRDELNSRLNQLKSEVDAFKESMTFSAKSGGSVTIDIDEDVRVNLKVSDIPDFIEWLKEMGLS